MNNISSVVYTALSGTVTSEKKNNSQITLAGSQNVTSELPSTKSFLVSFTGKFDDLEESLFEEAHLKSIKEYLRRIDKVLSKVYFSKDKKDSKQEFTGRDIFEYILEKTKDNNKKIGITFNPLLNLFEDKTREKYSKEIKEFLGEAKELGLICTWGCGKPYSTAVTDRGKWVFEHTKESKKIDADSLSNEDIKSLYEKLK
jgi:hypothetical protein